MNDLLLGSAASATGPVDSPQSPVYRLPRPSYHIWTVQDLQVLNELLCSISLCAPSYQLNCSRTNIADCAVDTKQSSCCSCSLSDLELCYLIQAPVSAHKTGLYMPVQHDRGCPHAGAVAYSIHAELFFRTRYAWNSLVSRGVQ